MVTSLTSIYNFGMCCPIGAYASLGLTFRLSRSRLFPVRWGGPYTFFSTLGNKWAHMTYTDLMLAWDMMAGLGGLKISHLSTIRLFLEDGAETVETASPGDQTPRSVVSNSNVYSRERARKRGPFHFRWLHVFSKS